MKGEIHIINIADLLDRHSLESFHITAEELEEKIRDEVDPEDLIACVIPPEQKHTIRARVHTGKNKKWITRVVRDAEEMGYDILSLEERVWMEEGWG